MIYFDDGFYLFGWHYHITSLIRVILFWGQLVIILNNGVKYNTISVRTYDITEIAAICEDKTFDLYILPSNAYS